VDDVDGDGQNRYISPRLDKLLGYTPAEWHGDPESWNKALHPADRERVLLEHARSARDQIPFVCEYRVLHRNGHVVWVRDEATLIHDEDGHPTCWQGVVIDITERKELEEQLSHQAFHDPLTNLANRALFTDRVSHALSRRTRTFNAPTAVLFVDMDDFKTVNDSLGHGTGDRLLKIVAERLQGCLRTADTAARLGGDEFAVLVEDISGPADAEQVATRIIDAFARPFRIDGRELHMGASIGIAITSHKSETVDDILRNADLAMYMAKRDKGGYAIFEPDMHAAVVGRMQLKADLSHAIDTGQLTLYYQPVIDMHTREMVGTEALLRWFHPVRGTVSPAEFIPLAEESDLIVEIGNWVLDEACRQAIGFQRSDPALADSSMTVNLSGRQLGDPRLVQKVADALDASGLRPDRLVLEITETALMTDVEASIDILTALKELGVRLAIDDFGTGYSSLSYLKAFPLDILKIDRSFVDGVELGEEEAALASAVVKLAQTLNLATVAEGVETPAQARTLLDIGCRLAQGFLYSPAVAPEAIASTLRSVAGA
jgi:diguanylate cyclase (GGDEF)-like protein/PAS domain S-box-containing protein